MNEAVTVCGHWFRVRPQWPWARFQQAGVDRNGRERPVGLWASSGPAPSKPSKWAGVEVLLPGSALLVLADLIFLGVL